MVTEYISSAQKGMDINATLVYLQSLLSDPKLALSSAQLNDVRERVRAAQELLNEVAGTRINASSVVGSVAESSQISLIHLAARELQNIARAKLGGKFKSVRMVTDKTMNNIVTIQPYKIFAIATAMDGSEYLLGMNEKGHYAFSDGNNWEEVPPAAPVAADA